MRQVTLALLKPDLFSNPFHILKVQGWIRASGVAILKQKSVHWTKDQASYFYAEHEGKFFQERLIQYMSR